MTKKEIQQRVLQNGKPLDLNKFEWDENNKIFSSSEDNLVLDFSDVNNCTFKTGSYCTFDTGYGCTFDTGYGCTFDTGSDCTFKTEACCVVVRRDIYEVIELKENIEIKLNASGIKGYTKVNTKKSKLFKKADELIKKAEELKVEANKII